MRLDLYFFTSPNQTKGLIMKKFEFTTALCKSGQLIEMMRPIVKAMNRSGYKYSIRYDMDGWARAREEMDPRHTVVMPTFDPAICDQSDSYWIEATSRENEVCAVIAARRFDTGDFVELMRTGYVWSDRPEHHRLRLCLSSSFSMKGAIVYRGGLCVRKDHRKAGLSWALPRLVSLISIDQGIDFIVSHNLADLHGNGFTFRVYGHAGSELCFDGTEYFPPTADKRKAYFVWTDLRSSLRSARRDNDILIEGGDKQLSDLAFLAQGPNKVSVPPRVVAGFGHH
jgi:hypothetical protein